MSNKIVINNLVKIYDGNKVLDNINISINKPGVYLLAGPNGSGKTTLLEILAGLREPSSGDILINNYRYNTIEAKRELGFLCQQNSLRKNTKVNEEIELVKDLYNISIDSYEYLKKFNLDKYYKEKTKNLSGGTKRRLLVAMLLMAKQNIVVLDEPVSGLDTYSRDEIWNIINEYAKSNIVIVSDHYLNQAAIYSDYIYLLNEGKVVLQGSLNNIKKKCKRNRLIKIRKEDFEEVKKIIAENCEDFEIRISGTVYNIFFNIENQNVLEILGKKNIHIHEIDLEDIYFYYTGKYSNEEGEIYV